MDVQGEKIQDYNTELEATGYERQAALTRSRRANPWAAAGQSLLGGVMQTYQQYNQYRMYTRQNARTSLGFWP